MKLLNGLNVVDALLTFLAALGAIASQTKLAAKRPWLLPAVFMAYLAGQLALVLATVGLTKMPSNPIDIAALVGLYILLSLWDLIAIIIGLPFIALTMILGPLMVVLFVLASVVLGMYLIERIIGYDLPGAASALETPTQALVASAVWIGSLLVLIWHFGGHKSGDWLIERAGDLIYNLRQQFQEMVQEITQQ